MTRSSLAAAVALTLLSACTPRAVIPDEERLLVEEELVGRARWLRVSANAAPFFGDGTRWLLTDQPVEEIELLESASGDKIPPPPAERVLPPGTRVRILAVEFPSPWRIAKRIVMTPRYHPWAVLDVDGDTRPYVIVLPQEAVRLEEINAELARLLSTDDPSAFLASLPREQQAAIRRRELIEGMSTRAAEMAWGQPEKRRIDRPGGTEDWTWPGARRTAHFREDRLAKWEER
jgi:hypothetical protein